jgi:hypothetical protein
MSGKSHESALRLGDRCPADGRRSFVNAQRTVLAIEPSDTFRILTAPRCNLVNSVSVILIAESAHEQVKLARIQTGLAIVLPRQLEKSESTLVGSKATIHRFIQIDEAASNHEQGHHRLW